MRPALESGLQASTGEANGVALMITINTKEQVN